MFKIKAATIDDLPGLARLFDQYRVFYEKEPDLKAAGIFLSERIKRSESVIFVADSDGGELIGFVQLYQVFSSTRMKRLWLLNDLFVEEKFRGKGISAGLIEQPKKLCRETGACGLILETAKSNHIGNALSPKTGFQLDEGHNFYHWDTN